MPGPIWYGRAWWHRLRGRSEPKPLALADAAILDAPIRALVAGPRRVLDAFAIRHGEHVLEIGSGTGYYSRELRRRIGPEGTLVCLDVQSDMIEVARRRFGGNLAPHFVRAWERRCPSGRVPSTTF